VLSTISGTPWACATFATASMSVMLPRGLPIEIAAAYAIGANRYQQICDHFGLHFTSVAKGLREAGK
jgi:hypothetical protein